LQALVSASAFFVLGLHDLTKADLVMLPKQWPLGSARFRDAYERLCVPVP
jgi:hypothetical protein